MALCQDIPPYAQKNILEGKTKNRDAADTPQKTPSRLRQP
jgi:hypothetical protein